MSRERKEKRHYIPVEEVAQKWMENPEFRAAYDALEDEFTLARAVAPEDSAKGAQR